MTHLAHHHPVSLELSPDTWADGEHGRFWGRYGAAGVLIQNTRAEAMLQLRADWCRHGGTWSIPGGARYHDESAIQAAFREAGEEHDFPVDRVRVTGSHVLDFGYWSYFTFVGAFHGEWEPRILTLSPSKCSGCRSTMSRPSHCTPGSAAPDPMSTTWCDAHDAA